MRRESEAELRSRLIRRAYLFAKIGFALSLVGVAVAAKAVLGEGL